jgi:hypothetical protein
MGFKDYDSKLEFMPKNSRTNIGCCGAYCKTCKPFTDGYCKGCKIGYESGERDLSRAKYKIKICCFKDNKLETCSDCVKYSNCSIFNNRFKSGSYSHKKYQEALFFINNHGYDEFIQMASNWKSSTGKFFPP